MTPHRLAWTPLDAFGRVLGRFDTLRNLRALAVLPGTFAAAGLLLAMTEALLALALPGLVYLCGVCTVYLTLVPDAGSG